MVKIGPTLGAEVDASQQQLKAKLLPSDPEGAFRKLWLQVLRHLPHPSDARHQSCDRSPTEL